MVLSGAWNRRCGPPGARGSPAHRPPETQGGGGRFRSRRLVVRPITVWRPRDGSSAHGSARRLARTPVPRRHRGNAGRGASAGAGGFAHALVGGPLPRLVRALARVWGTVTIPN